jgi:hypothetical protein
VAAVLDAPVAAVCFDDPPGVGLLRGGRLVMPQASSLERFPVFFFDALALDDEGLAHMGKSSSG